MAAGRHVGMPSYQTPTSEMFYPWKGGRAKLHRRFHHSKLQSFSVSTLCCHPAFQILCGKLRQFSCHPFLDFCFGSLAHQLSNGQLVMATSNFFHQGWRSSLFVLVVLVDLIFSPSSPLLFSFFSKDEAQASSSAFARKPDGQGIEKWKLETGNKTVENIKVANGNLKMENWKLENGSLNMESWKL